MTKYQMIQESHDCIQWFKHGDHPAVTEFNSPFKGKCRACGEDMTIHGWIKLFSDDFELTAICPGNWIVTSIGGCEEIWSDIAFKKVFK